MDLRQHLINFDNYKFRASGGGSLMTEPKEKSPKAQLEELEAKKPEIIATFRKKIEDAEAKRDAITNKSTKGYAAAEERVRKLNQEYETKMIEINSYIRELQPRTNEIFLSKTCRSYLIKCYIQEKYGRRDDLTNRYVKKGNQAEDNSIAILNEVDDVFPFYEKNTIRMFDDFKQGECDIFHDEKKILDAKSSWDLFTFMPKTVEELNSDYWWQGQIYMDLWDVDEYEVCYILTDTPDGIIADEQKRLLYAMGTNKKDTQAYAEGCKEIEYNLKYADIPIQERVFKVKVKRDREAIERLHKRIIECRLWLNQYSIERFISSYGAEEYKKLVPEEVKPVKVEFKPEIKVALVEVPVEKVEVVSPVVVPLEINLPTLDITLKASIPVVDMNNTNPAQTAANTAEIINEAANESVVITAAPEPVLSEIPEPIQSPDMDIIFGAIDKIDNITDLDRYKEELEDAYGEDEQFEEIYDYLVKRKGELNPRIIDVNIGFELTEKQIIESENLLPTEANPDYINARMRIDACTILEEVIELRKEIKSMFEEFPDLSDIITAKRDSLKPKEEVKEEPKKEPAKRIVIPAAPEPVVKQITLDEGIAAAKAEQPVANPDDELIKELYAKVKELKTKEEIQTLYRQHQTVIDKNLPLRRFMEVSIDKLKQIPQ